jgi:hypothetical protein
MYLCVFSPLPLSLLQYPMLPPCPTSPAPPGPHIGFVPFNSSFGPYDAHRVKRLAKSIQMSYQLSTYLWDLNSNLPILLVNDMRNSDRYKRLNNLGELSKCALWFCVLTSKISIDVLLWSLWWVMKEFFMQWSLYRVSSQIWMVAPWNTF